MSAQVSTFCIGESLCLASVEGLGNVLLFGVTNISLLSVPISVSGNAAKTLLSMRCLAFLLLALSGLVIQVLSRGVQGKPRFVLPCFG